MIKILKPVARSAEEIRSEISKVLTAKRNAERKRTRCVERLEELDAELKNAGGIK